MYSIFEDLHISLTHNVCEFQYWHFINQNPLYAKQISHFQMLYFCDNDNVMIPN